MYPGGFSKLVVLDPRALPPAGAPKFIVVEPEPEPVGRWCDESTLVDRVTPAGANALPACGGGMLNCGGGPLGIVTVSVTVLVTLEGGDATLPVGAGTGAAPGWGGGGEA